jgi:hypothetical protein
MVATSADISIVVALSLLESSSPTSDADLHRYAAIEFLLSHSLPS